MENNQKTNFISTLWDKKIPQYLGTYFAIGFGLLQFLEFAVPRYEMSSSLLDRFVLIWLLLIPAVIILIYLKGKILPSNDQNTPKWPKYTVFANVLIAFLFGIFFVKGNKVVEDKLVELTDEEGNKVEVFVPSQNKIKTIACFQFINDTKDNSLDWWGTAFSNLLQLSLNQWAEFYTSSQFELTAYYDELGLKSFTVPNLGLQKEIAQKSRHDFFSRISFNKVDGKYLIKGGIHSTNEGNSILKFEIVNESPFEAIDALASKINAHYFSEFEGQKKQINMPSSALITNNENALKNWTLSGINFQKNPNAIEEALTLSKKAVEEDPTCSFCHSMTGVLFFTQQKTDEANSYFKNAIKYGASLPKRFQFESKEIYYAINGDMESQIKLLELQRNMFPYDFSPYQKLKDIYLINKGVDSTKILINEAIENGNLEKGLLSLYDIQLDNKEYEEAEKTLKRLAKEFPGREQDKMKFADLYREQGKLDKAKKYLLELEALNPFDTRIKIDLAYLDFKNLEFEAALKHTEEGIQQASSLTDSLTFIWAKSFFYQRMGQMEESLQTINEYDSLSLKKAPLMAVLSRSMGRKMTIYSGTGKKGALDKLIAQLQKLAPQQKFVYPCVEKRLVLEFGYADKVDENAFAPCIENFKVLGQGFEKNFELLNAYNHGEYKNCVQLIEAEGSTLKNLFSDYFLSKIYGLSGNKNKAKELIKRNLVKKPDDPTYYFRMAELLEKEKPKEAKKQLGIAMKFWANADKDFILLQKAKELEIRLNQS